MNNAVAKQLRQMARLSRASDNPVTYREAKKNYKPHAHSRAILKTKIRKLLK